ncbi:Hypothetical predicted protein [Mytilus galloprovincialis]|uniref:Helitron helicase-like domain-containing protein n=1 Tax=Mytilus galloprovincialis TaxID=29158 RepID=A0A8B6EP35_MYTGA|nr:Hypothetical predicted protein [Mytilus galloprovincialis]
MPPKRRKCKHNSRAQRDKDKERKRRQRLSLKQVKRGEESTSDIDKPSTSRYQKLYKQNASYREKKLTASREQYKNMPYQTALKKSLKKRYKSNTQFQSLRKDYIKNKYRTNIPFHQAQKHFMINKYKTNVQFQQAQKDYMKKKYKLSKEYITQKYATDKDFQHKVKTLNLRYRRNVLYREKYKQRLSELYRRDLQYREKKKNLLEQKRKKGLDQIAVWFRQQVADGPKYICAVCIKFKFRKQVIQTNQDKYAKVKKTTEVAYQCICYQFKNDCTADCPVKCETINHKLWICYTCHRHLLKGTIPADAYANGLQLQTVPDELKSLNKLEKQLISLRIPFMKLVQLPKGNQRGIIGPCVSIPTDIQKTVNVLPLSDDDTQLIRCKLKRKQSYTGHCQYEFVNTTSIYKALHCLKDRNPYYKDISLNLTWHNDISSDFQDITLPEKNDDDHTNMEEEKDNTTQHNEEDENIKDLGFPHDTCLQPVDIGQEMLDQHFDDIFCVAPGEGSTPVSMMQEQGNEAMSFPVQFPDGSFGSFDYKRHVHLTRSRYFHARLLSSDDRFSSDSSYIFYAQYLSELEQVISKVSIALRKGTGKDRAGNAITASMLTDKTQLKNLLTTDQGYKFLTPIRGTPPYWQTALKDLLATIRQIGIPTWFATFSAADMRWTEVLYLLMEQQKSHQSLEDLDWTAKCEILRNNPVMNAVMFDHRFHTFLKEIIIKRSSIGKVKDHFHRIEFQQRGSPHAHCLFWIDDAPVLDEDDDQTVCDFVDRFVTCQMPDDTVDPELYEIVSSVQQHSKNHSKSCKKKGTTCRFNFPRPPSENTFI